VPTIVRLAAGTWLRAVAAPGLGRVSRGPLARSGGGEFAAVFHPATPPLIQSLADGLCTAVREQRPATGANRIAATISISISAAFFDAGTRARGRCTKRCSPPTPPSNGPGPQAATAPSRPSPKAPNAAGAGKPEGGGVESRQSYPANILHQATQWMQGPRRSRPWRHGQVMAGSDPGFVGDAPARSRALRSCGNYLTCGFPGMPGVSPCMRTSARWCGPASRRS
jgi:hypothetical protein